MKRFLVMMAVVLALVFAAVPMATYAQGIDMAGTGTVTAEGDGRAQLAGNGTVSAAGEAGTLWIFDRHGDATVHVEGKGRLTKTVLANGTVRYYYRGFNGTADISGRDYEVVLRGLNLTLSAEGSGRVSLWGDGTYTVDGDSGAWSMNGTHFVFGQ